MAWNTLINKRIRISSVIFLILLSSIITAVIYWLGADIKRYNHLINELQSNIEMGVYHDPVYTYFINNYENPESFDDLLWFISEYPLMKSYLTKYVDPFTNYGTLFCLPVYNPRNMKRESYLIASAGIDGFLGINISESDTIFEDQINSHIKFYNDIHFQRLPRYNILDRFFGKKDLIIVFFNSLEIYKNSKFEKITDLNEFIITIQNSNLSRRRRLLNHGYSFNVHTDRLFQENSYFVYDQSSFKIIFHFYDIEELSSIPEDTEISLIGMLNKIDTIKHEIEFILCMPIDNISSID
jgi:hypothetical protein